MTATPTIAVRKKTGSGAVTRLARLAVIKSQTFAGRRLPHSDIFDGFSYIGGSISTDDQCYRQTCAATPPIFQVLHTLP